MPDPKWGERPLLLIVPVETADPSGIEFTVKAAFAWVVDAGILSKKWAVPEEIRFVSEIAKTSFGKIGKKALRVALT